MSYKKSTQKDEEDLKEYTKAKTEVVAEEEQPTATKTDVKGLQKELGPNFMAFANADEHYRKRMLGEDYAAKKLKYGWLYDQKIE